MQSQQAHLSEEVFLPTVPIVWQWEELSLRLWLSLYVSFSWLPGALGGRMTDWLHHLDTASGPVC